LAWDGGRTRESSPKHISTESGSIRNHVFFSLFIRFADYPKLQASQTDEDFVILPFLHAVEKASAGLARSERPMSVCRGVFHAVIVGSRAVLCLAPAEIADFVRRLVEIPERGTVTAVEPGVRKPWPRTI
jgi:hypothetical protein